ncbi:MAG: hypothetical protein R2856_36035 [Caldilineaceae bacterium]
MDTSASAPWQEQTHLIGRALGKAAQNNTLVDQTEARFDEVRAANPSFAGATAAIVAPAGGDRSSSRVLNTKGNVFSPHWDLCCPPNWWKSPVTPSTAALSTERLDLVDTDVLIWTVSPEQQAEIEADALYQQLSVAEDGRHLPRHLGQRRWPWPGAGLQ